MPALDSSAHWWPVWLNNCDQPVHGLPFNPLLAAVPILPAAHGTCCLALTRCCEVCCKLPRVHWSWSMATRTAGSEPCMVRCWGTMQQSLSGPEDCWASDLDMDAIAVGMLRECKCLSSIVAIYFCALGNLVHTHYRAHTGRRFIAPKLQVFWAQVVMQSVSGWEGLLDVSDPLDAHLQALRGSQLWSCADWAGPEFPPSSSPACGMPLKLCLGLWALFWGY